MSDPQATHTEYYARRAAEYERIYAKPERQADLARLRSEIPTLFAGHNVLEVACGTGYWTQSISQRAQAVFATDINASVLDIARAKSYAVPVRFAQADLNALPKLSHACDALFGGFIWSHIPRQDLPDFLQKLAAPLAPGARMLFLDNRYVAGSSTPLSRTDAAGNTFQLRSLDDGSSYEVMKNFPAEAELQAVARSIGANAEVVLLPYYWYLILDL